MQYRIQKNIDGTISYPKMWLMTKTLHKISQIYPYDELSITTKFNEANTCSFSVYKVNNGIELPYWDRIKDLSVILVEGFGLFEIKVSIIENESTTKKITGQSLQECELGQIIGSWEINTSDDIETKSHYEDCATIFYRPISSAYTDKKKEECKNTSLIHRILSYAPHYEIGHIDVSLWNINREFSVSKACIFDFMQTVSKEIGCIFIFDPYARIINVFDMEDHCTNPSCTDSRHIFSGECQGCHSSEFIEKGYGKDIATYIDTTNIVEELEDTVNADGIKNCVKIVGGDDAITNQIGQRLIGNSNCIWTFSDEQIEEMSKPLQEKWLGYADFVSKYQDIFNDYWDEFNQITKDKLYEESGKMPIIETNDQYNNDNPSARCEEIYEDIIKKNITYGSIGYQFTTPYTLSKNILSYARLYVPEGYQIKFQKKGSADDFKCDYGSDGAISKWYGKLYVYLLDATDETTGEDKYYYSPTDYWTLPIEPGYSVTNSEGKFTNSYFKWMKQQLDMQLQDDNKTKFQPKYDTDYADSVSNHLNDADYYMNYFSQYSRNRLQSFYDAYSKCSVIIESLAGKYMHSLQEKFNYIVSDGSVSSKSLFDKLMEKYREFMKHISVLMKESQDKIDAYQKRMDELKGKIEEINRICSPETYFGDLYNELMMFKREDVYENNNFTSEVLDDELMQNIEELILNAKQEVAKCCQNIHNVSLKLGNILSANSFSDQIGYVSLGNYIRTRIQGVLTKIRIIEFSINFDNIESSDITFSDVTVGCQPITNVRDKLDKAASMATNFDFIVKQSDRNDKKVSKFDDMFNDGLKTANMMIKSNDSEDFIIDNYGILGRQWNKDANAYDDCQLRITHNIIGFTKDNWNTLSMAIGKIIWNEEPMYGVIADALIGKMLVGNRLEISNNGGTYTMDDDGFHIANGKNKIEMNAKESKFFIEKDNKKIFSYSPKEGLYIEGAGKFTGEINVNDNFIVSPDGTMTCEKGVFKGEINVNDYFTVDSDGNAVAKSIEITGGKINFATSLDGDSSILLRNAKYEGAYDGPVRFAGYGPPPKDPKQMGAKYSDFYFDRDTGRKYVSDVNDKWAEVTIDVEINKDNVPFPLIRFYGTGEPTESPEEMDARPGELYIDLETGHYYVCIVHDGEKIWWDTATGDITKISEWTEISLNTENGLSAEKYYYSKYDVDSGGNISETESLKKNSLKCSVAPDGISFDVVGHKNYRGKLTEWHSNAHISAGFSEVDPQGDDVPYAVLKSDSSFYAPNFKSGFISRQMDSNVLYCVEVKLNLPSAPNVVATPVTSNPAAVNVSVADVSKLGFKIYMRRIDGNYPLGVHWIAMC